MTAANFWATARLTDGQTLSLLLFLSISGEHPLWLINTLLLMVFGLEFGEI